MSKNWYLAEPSFRRRTASRIYIEREKISTLVWTRIYKGKVTRVFRLQSFRGHRLDGDAFLYVSDVFENLEDYDPVHPHEQPQSSAPALPAAIDTAVEVLPGETLAHATRLPDEALRQPSHSEEDHHVTKGTARMTKRTPPRVIT